MNADAPDNNVIVSIVCNAYNHEKYIAQALESFINQVTSFRFEIIVHDDASTDSTADIILEYAKKYPDIIFPLIQKQNQYSQGTDIFLKYQIPRCKGKYIAFCEGDDYWTSNSKLQKQYEFMENNLSFSLCVHKAVRVNESGCFSSLYTDYSNIENDIVIPPQQAIQNLFLFPTASMFFRKTFYNDNYEILRKVKGFDYVYKILLAMDGSVYMLNEFMSTYREASVGSWSECVNNNKEKLIEHYLYSINALELIKEYKNQKYSAYIDHEIQRRKAKIAILKKNYKEFIKPEYKQYLKESSLKHKIRIMVGLILGGKFI